MKFTPKTWRRFLKAADFELCWLCLMGFALTDNGEILAEDLAMFSRYGLRRHLRRLMKGFPCQEVERQRLELADSFK